MAFRLAQPPQALIARKNPVGAQSFVAFVAAERLRVLEAGDSTHGEVEAIAREVGERRGLLVTSAAHMRRALRIAESAGVDAVPAATDFRLHPEDARFVARWLPSTHELDKSERALHEYFAAMRPRPARHRHRR